METTKTEIKQPVTEAIRAVDTMTSIGQSLVQHGKCNDRIYLMSIKRKDIPKIFDTMKKLIKAKGYSKIFAKVPESAAPDFKAENFEEEACVPRLFNAKEDGYFMSKFIQPTRRKDLRAERVQDVLSVAKKRTPSQAPSHLESSFQFRPCTRKDANEMAELYRMVFKTYPFPIHEPAFLQKTMEENVSYYGVWHGKTLVALSSMEMDREHAYAEMTDFATRPGFQGRGFASYLLGQMENDMPVHGIRTAYTIARGTSYSMNITFSKWGYSFAGTLKNNTWISGKIESMNVWYKSVPL